MILLHIIILIPLIIRLINNTSYLNIFSCFGNNNPKRSELSDVTINMNFENNKFKDIKNVDIFRY